MTPHLPICRHPALSWLGKACLLAAAYFLFGKLGLLLAVPPGYATAVWPPSGIALVGLLLLGRRHCPGIWLGSFCVNVGMSFDGSSTAGMLASAGVAASIASGAALQAVVGVSLVRRFVPGPLALIRAREIFSFMVVSGPLGCLVAPTCGIITLVVAGVVPRASAAVNWGTWWIGDTLGVWIFTIVGLVAFGQPRAVWQTRWRSIALPLVVSFAASVGIFRFVQKNEAARQRSVFVEKAQAQASRLVLATRTNQAILHGLAALFDASPKVSRQEFHIFTKQALRLYGGIEALAWIPRVAKDRRGEFEDTAHREGYAEYELKELVSGRLVRAGDRAVYFPAFYVEKTDGDEKPTGFDLGSEPTRFAALQQACDFGSAQATVPVNFLSGKGRGIIVTLPVYDMSGLTQTLRSAEAASDRAGPPVALRRERLRGFVTGAFLLDHISGEALDKTARQEMQLFVEDVTEASAPVFVFASGKGINRRTASAPSAVDWSTTMKVGERLWRLRFIPTLEYRSGAQSLAGWAVLAGAFFFTSLLGSVLLIITGGTTLVEQTVAERTAELTSLNQELQSEVAERRRAEDKLKVSEARFRNAIDYSAIGFALVGLDGRWIQVNAALCRILGFTAQELSERTFQDITHPEDLRSDLDHVQDLLAGRITHYHLEKRYVHRAGDIVWVLLSVSLVRHTDGAPFYFVSQIQDITERKRADFSLKASLEEKEVLLREVHHRVKNNMQVISSLLNLQAAAANGPEDEAMFHECQLRIQAMAMIHDRLYRSPSLATIDFGAHLADLAALIVRSSPSGGARIELRTDCAHVEVPLDTAIPLGLVATELVSNACKHAYHGRPNGQLAVELQSNEEGGLTLRVSDDGPGLPDGYHKRKAKSLGMRLIENLTRQMRGRLAVSTNGHGAHFEVTLQGASASSIAPSTEVEALAGEVMG